jgi:hypothetical protein
MFECACGKTMSPQPYQFLDCCKAAEDEVWAELERRFNV